MQIVIDIQEERYEWIKNHTGVTDYRTTEKIYESVRNGTPLPKGHGRLIDGDKLYTDMENGIYAGLLEEGYEKYGHINNMDDCLEEVKFADTVIPAQTWEFVNFIENSKDAEQGVRNDE